MSARFILKVTEIEGATLEDLFVARAQLKTIDDGYQEFRADTPEWVPEYAAEIHGEIVRRVRADLTRKLKMAKARRGSLATNEEKRRGLDADIAALEAQLGPGAESIQAKVG